MGIIQKQSIKGTIYSYIGVFVGFITTGLLFPKILQTEEIGLLKLLVSISVIFAQFGSLGFNSAMNRLFPYFRNKTNKHNGIITLGLIISLAGFLLSFLIFILYKPQLVRNNIEDSALLVEYFFLVAPLILTTIFFNLFDTYNKVLYDAVFGTFLKELLQRLLILCSLLMYFFNILDFRGFVFAYVLSFYIPTLILLILFIFRKEISLKISKEVFQKSMLRQIISISVYGIIGGLGSIAIIHIDSLMVNKFLGISSTGIYTIMFFFGTLVLIPSRPLIKISTTVIADSWKSSDLKNINLIYSKSCINQAIIGAFIFLGLWVNIQNILQILPAEFEAGKYVILFIGLANFFEMSAGASGVIISTSSYYRYNTVLIIIYLILIVVLNFIFIPIYGLTGAAIATTFSKLSYTGMRFLFLKHRFKLQPYKIQFIYLLIIAGIAYFVGSVLPELNNYILDILYRSFILTLVFALPVYFFGISSDVNDVINNSMKKLGINLPSKK